MLYATLHHPYNKIINIHETALIYVNYPSFIVSIHTL